MNIKTILVPSDFSENADRAFATAIQFARAFDAQIQLLHVYDIPDTTTVYEVTFPTGVVDGIRQAASVKLEALKKQAKAEGITSSTELVFGSPSQCIVEHAKNSKAFLIVMGTCSHGSLKRLFLGSVAERTLRTAPCPVLTVGMDTTSEP
jgi:nucleotide-binding universal stress UspA family protein